MRAAGNKKKRKGSESGRYLEWRWTRTKRMILTLITSHMSDLNKSQSVMLNVHNCYLHIRCGLSHNTDDDDDDDDGGDGLTPKGPQPR